MNNIVKILDWDSNFFNKKIGSVFFDKKNIESCVFFNFDILYVYSKHDIKFNIPQFINTYSECKVFFCKYLKVESYNINEKNIFLNPSIDDKANIERLAIQSGEFSRFNLDINFKKEDFERLYKIWINKSLDLKEKEEILTYFDGSKVIGFIGFVKEKKNAKVTLLVVDAKNRGKGIASKLLDSLESHLIKSNIKKITIPTQKVNKIACNFYKNKGYYVVDEFFLKHYWKI